MQPELVVPDREVDGRGVVHAGGREEHALELEFLAVEAAVSETKEDTELEVFNLVESHSGVAPVLRAYYTIDYVGNVKIGF